MSIGPHRRPRLGLEFCYRIIIENHILSLSILYFLRGQIRNSLLFCRWLPIMKAYEAGQAAYFATPPVQLIYAFNASLRSITRGKVSVEERFRLHREASAKFKKAMGDLGLKQVYSPTLCHFQSLLGRVLYAKFCLLTRIVIPFPNACARAIISSQLILNTQPMA